MNFLDVNSNSDNRSFNDLRRYGSGLGIGFNAVKTVSNRLSIETGLELSIKRTVLDPDPQPVTTIDNPEGTGEFIEYSDATTSIYLLSLPVNVQLEMFGGFKVHAGPLVDIKLGNNTDSYDWEYNGDNFSQEDNMFDFAETFNFGYSIGLGKGFNLAGRDVFTSIQFRRDITEMIRDDSFISLRKQSIELWVGVPIF